MTEPGESSEHSEVPGEPAGNLEKDQEVKEVITAELIGTHVVVWNPKDGSTLYKEGYYGQPISIRKPKTFDFNCPVELSLLEALYLIEKQRIKLIDEKTKNLITAQQLREYGTKVYQEFDDKYLVYKDLRSRGYIVRPGLKFGADYAVYQHGPGIDHAPFVVHALPKGTTINPIETVRAGRLATTVRKKFIIATISPDLRVSYLIFEWRKM
nr:tRNA-intron lyase [Candidatus Njordarchaeum guaymaensis]